MRFSSSSFATAVVEAGSGKYRKTTPSTQYSPASFPPAMTEVNLAMSSGVLKKVFSITIISLNGEYVMLTSGLFIALIWLAIVSAVPF